MGSFSAASSHPASAPALDGTSAHSAAASLRNGGAASPAAEDGDVVTDLLDPAVDRSRSSRSVSDLGGGIKIGPNVGAELMRGISSVGTVISNEKTEAVMRMLEESVRK